MMRALRRGSRGLLKASIGSPPHPLDPLPTLRGEGDAPSPSSAGVFRRERLAVAGVWLAGRRLYDPATGLLAAAALACSPFALLMAADAMAHVPALCAAVWCLAMLAGVVEDRPGSGDVASSPAVATAADGTAA